MANPEHLEILKQGVESWNLWRRENDGIMPDLSYADLSCTDLNYTDLRSAYLRFANLCQVSLRGALLNDANLASADLSSAELNYADLSSADLSDVDLRGTYLRGANLYRADLGGADLRGAYLERASLGRANLAGANLSGANLTSANLIDAYVDDANFHRAVANRTAFTGNDLRMVKGLESIIHTGPSEVSINTIYRSQGHIPEVFLRGCGLSDWQVESAKLYQPELSNEELTNILYRIHHLHAHQPIQINSLFISYSHADTAFVDMTERYLNQQGIRFWRDIHHATSGRLERQIDRAIRLNPTVLLVLSKHSVESDWVQHEARLARKLEIETKRDVLCPVALDDSWKNYHWPERLREQIMEYNILDFSNWKDEDKFQHMFSRLIDGLDLFYK
jgi:uncharacterized protein YjbI with pentapeptide repeats